MFFDFLSKEKPEARPKKKWPMIFLVVAILIFVILKLFDYFYWPETTVKIGGQTISVLVADRPSHWQKGWSGRKSMGEHGGMLFVFSNKSQHIMVMREMNFPLDIVWLDGNKIIDLASNIQPEPGKSEVELTRYRARLPSTAVLELPASFMVSNGLKIGDTVIVGGS